MRVSAVTGISHACALLADTLVSGAQGTNFAGELMIDGVMVAAACIDHFKATSQWLGSRPGRIVGDSYLVQD